jgi:hypothetical protein
MQENHHRPISRHVMVNRNNIESVLAQEFVPLQMVGKGLSGISSSILKTQNDPSPIRV